MLSESNFTERDVLPSVVDRPIIPLLINHPPIVPSVAASFFATIFSVLIYSAVIAPLAAFAASVSKFEILSFVNNTPLMSILSASIFTLLSPDSLIEVMTDALAT